MDAAGMLPGAPTDPVGRAMPRKDPGGAAHAPA